MGECSKDITISKEELYILIEENKSAVLSVLTGFLANRDNARMHCSVIDIYENTRELIIELYDKLYNRVVTGNYEEEDE